MYILTPLDKLTMNKNSYIPAEPGDLCYSLRTEKEGWLLCNGQAVSRTDYANLFEIIGTIFGSGDGSTTFNIPNYSGKFLQMDTSKTIGTNIEAGLPNITAKLSGNRGFVASDLLSITGAFSGQILQQRQFRGSTEIDVLDTLSFNASLSNSIYGNSTTVQPPASIVNYFIKY